MHTLLGVSLYILHGLGRHRLLGATLGSWLLVVLFLGAGLAWIGWLPGDVVLIVLLLILAAILIASQRWAQRRFYVYFSPEAAAAPTPSPLPPTDKIATQATGLFAVDERTAAFTNLAAFYRTYPTREHAILARKTPTRFLGLGEADPTLVGMWYIFVAPAALTGVRAGTIGFGRSQRPGLRIDYVRTNKKDQPVAASAYLSFEEAGERDRAWADLLVESGRGEVAE